MASGCDGASGLPTAGRTSVNDCLSSCLFPAGVAIGGLLLAAEKDGNRFCVPTGIFGGDCCGEENGAPDGLTESPVRSFFFSCSRSGW